MAVKAGGFPSGHRWGYANRMRAAALLALVALTAACQDATEPLTGQDGGVAEAGPIDAQVPDAGILDADTPDLGPFGCLRPEDCPQDFEPFSLPTCPNSGWSCLDHACTWDCAQPGRTCEVILGPTGDCVVCEGSNTVCPDVACSVPPFTEARLEQPGSCARVFHVSVTRCQGDFAWLDDPGDRRLCAFTELPTGALRAVLSCGFCQEQVMW